MRTNISFFLAVALACFAADAQAQETVQLPTFSFNTVNTTVTAPDGGTIGLGGVARASTGRTERSVPMLGKLPYAGRLFGNRAIGQDFSNGYTTVTPRIIILEEEEAKLGLPDYSSGAPIGGVLSTSSVRNFGQSTRELNETDVRALRLSQHVANNQLQQPVAIQQPAGPSAEEIRQRNELAAQARNSEAYKFFDKGQAAEDAGKAGVAKIYYNMAARRAPDELKPVIEARLEALQQQ
mgnify:CR=1 FL=1